MKRWTWVRFMDNIAHILKEVRIYFIAMKVKVQVPQLGSTLWDPMDCIVHGILQARILEWVAFPFSRGSSQPRDRIQASWIAGRFFYQLSHKGRAFYCYRHSLVRFQLQSAIYQIFTWKVLLHWVGGREWVKMKHGYQLRWPSWVITRLNK